MPVILCIETATTACSVALIKDGHVLGSRHSHSRNAHSTVLNLFIDELLSASGFRYTDLKAVAVSKGPGSYTGLRIGVSTAKGLCYALDIPLIAPDTLVCMASGFASGRMHLPGNALLCPMIDARRMEIFTAVYTMGHQPLIPADAVIMDEGTFSRLDAERPVYYFGEGAGKCLNILSARHNWHFIPDFYNSATHMASIATERYALSRFEDVAYFEPYYLKDFIAAKPNVKGLR